MFSDQVRPQDLYILKGNEKVMKRLYLEKIGYIPEGSESLILIGID